MKNFSDFAREDMYNKNMGILENFENAWDDFEFESKPIIETNNLGEKIQGTQELSLDEEVIDN
jgi:hypothetical protein